MKDSASSELAVAEVVNARLRNSDRVLVLGAGGWFGKSLLEVLERAEVPVLSIASTSRALVMPTSKWQVHTWNPETVADFAPTVVANFALLPRHRQTDLGETRYRLTNEELLTHFEFASCLGTVRAVVTASSGAVVQGPRDAYREFKQREEDIATASQSSSRAVVIARAFSVSGPWVREPNAYAFSNFITQARNGAVVVRATRPTWRRYVDAGEYLGVCLALALEGAGGIVESGGDLLEMRTLATLIREAVNPSASMDCAAPLDDALEIYASDGVSWRQALEDLSYMPMDLPAQIRRTAQWLIS